MTLCRNVSLTRFLFKLHLGSRGMEAWRGVRLELRSSLEVQVRTDESSDWVMCGRKEWVGIMFEEAAHGLLLRVTLLSEVSLVPECKAQPGVGPSCHPDLVLPVCQVCMLLPVEYEG